MRKGGLENTGHTESKMESGETVTSFCKSRWQNRVGKILIKEMNIKAAKNRKIKFCILCWPSSCFFFVHGNI